MSVPAAFVGAWQRRSIAFGDEPPGETLDVIWLQTGPGPFADIRIDRATGAPVACFAGTTTWTPPQLTWHHELDLAPIGRPDVGTVSWHGGDLVETGETVLDGETVAYTEVWHRLPPTGEVADHTTDATHDPDDHAAGPGPLPAPAPAPAPTPAAEAERGEGRMRVRVGHHEIRVDDRRPGGPFTATYTVGGRVALAVDTRRVPPAADPLRGLTGEGTP